MQQTIEFDEPILPDDYPVYWDYVYLGDGKMIMSPLMGTVLDLKRQYGYKEVRRCDIVEREIQLRNEADAKREPYDPVKAMRDKGWIK